MLRSYRKTIRVPSKAISETRNGTGVVRWHWWTLKGECDDVPTSTGAPILIFPPGCSEHLSFRLMERHSGAQFFQSEHEKTFQRWIQKAMTVFQRVARGIISPKHCRFLSSPPSSFRSHAPEKTNSASKLNLTDTAVMLTWRSLKTERCRRCARMKCRRQMTCHRQLAYAICTHFTCSP